MSYELHSLVSGHKSWRKGKSCSSPKKATDSWNSERNCTNPEMQRSRAGNNMLSSIYLKHQIVCYDYLFRTKSWFMNHIIFEIQLSKHFSICTSTRLSLVSVIKDQWTPGDVFFYCSFCHKLVVNHVLCSCLQFLFWIFWLPRHDVVLFGICRKLMLNARMG